MASNPTWAEIWTQIGNRVHVWNELDKFCNSNTPNLLGMEDTLIQGTEGAYAANGLAGFASDRAAISAILSPANLRRSLTPYILELGRAIGATERDIPTLMFRIREYMNDNSVDINSRGPTFNAASAGGSNVGNGNLYRVTVDQFGFNLEAQHYEAKEAKCVRDQNQVNEHEEVFLFKGVEAEQDFCQVLGSGVVNAREIRCVSARDSLPWVLNPSFSEYGGTTQPTAGSPQTITSTTAITSWTASQTTGIQVGIDSPAVYRDFFGDAVPKWVSIASVNVTLTQIIKDVAGGTFDPFVPYFLGVAVYRASSATGNIVVTLGSSSRTVALSGLNNNAWNWVTWQATQDDSNYYQNFQQQDLDIQLQTTSLSGTIYIDDVVLSPFVKMDGTWYLPVGGATPFLRDDIFTWTDTENATRGILSYWFWRAGLGHLKSVTDTSETISDPS